MSYMLQKCRTDELFYLNPTKKYRMADICKSVSLAHTSVRLHKTNIFEYPSNTVIDYYDSIHKLMEAITLIEGFIVHQNYIDLNKKTIETIISSLTSYLDELFLKKTRD